MVQDQQDTLAPAASVLPLCSKQISCLVNFGYGMVCHLAKSRLIKLFQDSRCQNYLPSNVLCFVLLFRLGSTSTNVFLFSNSAPYITSPCSNAQAETAVGTTAVPRKVPFGNSPGFSVYNLVHDPKVFLTPH